MESKDREGWTLCFGWILDERLAILAFFLLCLSMHIVAFTTAQGKECI